MSQLSLAFDPLPSTMNEADFLAVFGGVYEHSPWVAEQVWRGGLRERHDDVDGLAQAMAKVVDTANSLVKHTLINNHPDLAGRAAVAGELTAESTEEQSSAGIHLCTPAEFEQFTGFNRDYKRRFGITFVMAVKHSNRHQILAAFEERLSNDPTTEFRRAISEIHRIARFRLEAIAEAQRND